ncbi:MAG: 4Fe-4S binding protein [Candidatus Jordarchaeales archaeon]
MMEAYKSMNVYKLHINSALCVGCNDCVVACPHNASLPPEMRGDIKNYTIIVRNGKAIVSNQSFCDGCGICIEACGPKAISLKVAK